jgi:hypothetical protein
VGPSSLCPASLQLLYLLQFQLSLRRSFQQRQGDVAPRCKMKVHNVVALVLWLFASLATASPPNYNNPGPTATISSGVVHGVATIVPGSSITVNKFLGIPFAAQPERFSPARPPAPWPTPYEATSYGPACIQQFNYPAQARDRFMGWFNQPPPPESEDCLNVNVFAPATRGKKAVLLWIYGVRASRWKW